MDSGFSRTVTIIFNMPSPPGRCASAGGIEHAVCHRLSVLMKLVLVDLQRPDPGFERRHGNAQTDGGTLRPGDAAMRLAQGCFDLRLQPGWFFGRALQSFRCERARL